MAGAGRAPHTTRARARLDVEGTTVEAPRLANPDLDEQAMPIRQAFGPGWPFALCVATAESGQMTPYAPLGGE